MYFFYFFFFVARQNPYKRQSHYDNKQDTYKTNKRRYQEQYTQIFPKRSKRLMFKVCSLIKDLPSGFQFSAVALFEKNIYIGTTNGDLFHYMEIGPAEYVLISKASVGASASNLGIKSIHAIRSIARALILTTTNQVLLYELPEFQLVQEQNQIHNIKEISLHSVTKDTELVFIDINNQGRVYNITKEKNIEATNNVLKNVRKFYRQKNTVLTVTKDGNFELIKPAVIRGDQTKRSRPEHIPLFKAFETPHPDETWEPVAAVVSDTGFVIVCGSLPTEPSMALIIDHDGNITNGTIVLERGYPSNVVVQGLFLFFQFEQQVDVFQLGKEEAKFLQSLELPNFYKADEELKVLSDDEAEINLVVEILRLVPTDETCKTASSSSVSVRKDQENMYVKSTYESKTNLLAFDNESIKLVAQPPIFLSFRDFEESSIKKCERYFETTEVRTAKAKETEFEKLQTSYIETFYLVLLLLHCGKIDSTLMDKFLQRCMDVDLRLLYYMLDFHVYGDLWVFNGLLGKIKKLKILKFTNKIDSIVDFMERALVYFSEEANVHLLIDLKDGSNVNKTITMSYVNCWIAECEKIETQLNVGVLDLTHFEKEILELLRDAAKHEKNKKHSQKFKDAIKQIFLQTKEYDEYLQFLLDESNISEAKTFFFDQYDNIKSENLKTTVIHKILKDKNQNFATVVPKLCEIIKKESLNFHELLEQINDVNLKIEFLEYQIMTTGDDATKDSALLLDYYIAQVNDLLMNQGLLDILNQWQSSYIADLGYGKKPSFGSYLRERLSFEIEVQSDEAVVAEKLIKLKGKLRSMAQKEHNSSEAESCLTVFFTKFKEDVPLIFLVFDELSEVIQKMGEKETFELLLMLNDFESINLFFINQANFVKILKSYLGLNQSGSTVALRFMESNYQTATKNTELCVQVLQILPSEWKCLTISSFLYYSLMKLRFESQNFELQKALVKQHLQERKQILDRYSKR